MRSPATFMLVAIAIGIAEFNAAGQCFCGMEDDAKELCNRTLTDADAEVPVSKN